METKQQTLKLIGLSCLTLGIQFISMFLPWFQLGERNRSSFEVLDAAITFSPSFNTVAAVIEAGWIFLPALGLTFILLWVADLSKIGRVGSRAVIITYILFGLMSAYFSGLEAGTIVCLLAGIGYLAGLAIIRQQVD